VRTEKPRPETINIVPGKARYSMGLLEIMTNNEARINSPP